MGKKVIQQSADNIWYNIEVVNTEVVRKMLRHTSIVIVQVMSRESEILY